MYPIQLISDLSLESDEIRITILSNEKEIAIAITGEAIPKIDVPFRKLYGMYKNFPLHTDQLITVVYNQKEIYRSDKSLLSKANWIFVIRTFFKNLF
ncbi:hypothetical protein [Pararhodonellum marinum]|uniref:hypothetical protein n=1 Tax=Pararhodonellum marinum TaxID=2755358 RepID=UPI00188F1DFE|nr:hypothetical protein [Pararhodonellum marinum]